MSFELEADPLFRMMVRHFESIDDACLTPNDKNKLKDFYLQNFIAPKARKLLEKHFPEEFGKAASSPTASKTRPHQNRH
jgi:hypothetical protein